MMFTLHGANVAVAPCHVAGARRRQKTARRMVVALGGGGNGDSLYSVLGVPQGASDKEIKRAYRRLALKFHPDVNKEPDAVHKFMRIKQAYQTLIDPPSRAKYEASSGGDRKQAREEDFYGLDDFFRDLQAEFDKTSASSSRPKSLWEELADIGEEFLQFLEKDLDVPDGETRQEEPMQGQDKDGKSDIEDMLEQLKRELGLQ